MCCSPVTIRNPKIKAGTFLVSVDKEYISVPCGHCSECLNAKRRDLVFRGYFEYLETISKKGFVMFDTLTFNEFSLCRFEFFPYFNKKIIQGFIKRLKSNLEYKGYQVAGNLKYMIVSEFGENTYRPHYHPIWFVTIPNLDSRTFNAFVRAAWKDTDIDKSLGFNDYHSVENRIVNSIHGIQYIVKYITKAQQTVLDALKYHSDSGVTHFMLNGEDDLTNFSILRQKWLSYKFINGVPKEYDLFPQVLCSHGLGKNFLDNMSIEDLFNPVFLPCKSKIKQQDYFNVPSYYIRKVFYNYDKDSKRYMPNEFYPLLDKKRCEDSVQNIKDNQILVNDIWKCISIDDKTKIRKKFGLTDTDTPITFVSRLLNGRDVSHFAKYVVYLRNIHISPYHEWLYSAYLVDLDYSWIELFTEYRYDALQYDALPFRVFDETVQHSEIHMPYRSVSIGLFNDLPYFKDYDIIYKFIQTIMQYYKNAKAMSFAELEKQHKFEKQYKQQFSDCIVN